MVVRSLSQALLINTVLMLNVLMTTESAFALSCPRLQTRRSLPDRPLCPDSPISQTSSLRPRGKERYVHRQAPSRTEWKPNDSRPKPSRSLSSLWFLQAREAYYYFRVINIYPSLSFHCLRMEIFSPRCWNFPGNIVFFKEKEEKNQTKTRKTRDDPFRILHIWLRVIASLRL